MAEFNELSPDQRERLYWFIEECSEAIHVATKVLIHGYNSGDPRRPKTCNRGDLAMEIGHIRVAAQWLIAKGDILEGAVLHYARSKDREVDFWLHEQGGHGCCGRLETVGEELADAVQAIPDEINREW